MPTNALQLCSLYWYSIYSLVKFVGIDLKSAQLVLVQVEVVVVVKMVDEALFLLFRLR